MIPDYATSVIEIFLLPAILVLLFSFLLFAFIEIVGSVAILFGKRIIDNDTRKFWTANWFFPVGFIDWMCALLFRGRYKEDLELIKSGKNRKIIFVIRFVLGILGIMGSVLIIVAFVLSIVLNTIFR